MIAPGEPGNIADVAGDGPGDHRADAEDLREGGARGPDRGGQLLPGITQLPVEVTQVGQELSGELGPGQRDSTGRRGLRQDPGSVSCGYLLRMAAGDQVAEHGVQPAGDLVAGPGQVAVALEPAPSAPPGSPRRSPRGRPWTAAPRPPPAGRRPGRSCSCPRPAAAAPGTPAWAAHPGPAHRRRRVAGRAGAPGRLHLRPPRSAPATPPPTRSASRPGQRRRGP